MRSSGGHGLMPEGTGPLRDLHPQILRRRARAREFNSLQAQRETCEPRTRRLGVPVSRLSCLKVIMMGGFSGAAMHRSLRRLLADITAGRASAIRSAASSPTSSPAVRYWNRARQRYHRLSVRYSRARVSLPTQAARPGPNNRGKPRLLDLERRIPARDRFAPDSPLEEAGFEILVPVRQAKLTRTAFRGTNRRY